MKILLLLACAMVILTVGGCIVAEDGRHGHGGYEHRDAVIVGPPVVVVRPPEIIVH